MTNFEHYTKDLDTFLDFIARDYSDQPACQMCIGCEKAGDCCWIGISEWMKEEYLEEKENK